MKKVVLGKTGMETHLNAFGALPIQRVSDEYAVKLLRRNLEDYKNIISGKAKI